MTAIVINDLDYYRRPLDSESELPVDGDVKRPSAPTKGRLWLRVTDTNRERVHLSYVPADSWAWRVSDRGDMTLVEFPTTERTGWYRTDELVTLP